MGPTCIYTYIYIAPCIPLIPRYEDVHIYEPYSIMVCYVLPYYNIYCTILYYVTLYHIISYHIIYYFNHILLCRYLKPSPPSKAREHPLRGPECELPPEDAPPALLGPGLYYPGAVPRIGGPLCGCCYNKSSTIFGVSIGQLVFGFRLEQGPEDQISISRILQL